MAERLRVTGARKIYGAREVLRDVSFAVAEGEVLALVGPSGGGKTTTLNLVAGLDRPDAGEIRLSGAVVSAAGTWVPPHRRDLGVVFQGQALWPHLSVAAHLAFVLSARGVPKREHAARVAAQLDAVQLKGRDAARPAELSGGEAQRLSIARALVARPGLLLLDEPCANLDTTLQAETLALLARLRRELGFAALYVTHSAAEAFEIADRIAVLDDGKLVQIGPPKELYERPAAPAVARLLGGGFLLEGTLEQGGQARTALGSLALDAAAALPAPGGAVTLFVREEDLRVASDGPLAAVALASHFDGRGWVVRLETGGGAMRARAEEAVAPGTRVALKLVKPARAFPA